MKDYGSNISSLNSTSSPYIPFQLPRNQQEPSYSPFVPGNMALDGSDELEYLRRASNHQSYESSEQIDNMAGSIARSNSKPTSFGTFLKHSGSVNAPYGSTLNVPSSINNFGQSQLSFDASRPRNNFDTSRSGNLGQSRSRNRRDVQESFDSTATVGKHRGNSGNSIRSTRFDHSFVYNSNQFGAPYLDESNVYGRDTIPSFNSPPKRAPLADYSSLKSSFKPPRNINGDLQKSARFDSGNDRHYSYTSFVSDEMDNSVKRTSGRRRESNLDESNSTGIVPMSIYELILVWILSYLYLEKDYAGR
jgi:hypothetical protein